MDQPIQPYQAPAPQPLKPVEPAPVQAQITPTPEKPKVKVEGQNKLGSLILKFVLIAGLFLLGLLAGYLIGFQSNEDSSSDDTATDTEVEEDIEEEAEDETETEEESTEEIEVSVQKPAINEVVTGVISYQGTVSESDADLLIRVEDFNDNILAEQELGTLTSKPSGLFEWKGNITLTISPISQLGSFKIVHATTEEELYSVPIQFKTITVTDRLKVYGPQENQIISGDTTLFSGEMKGFFEGNVSVKILGSNGTEIFRGSVQATPSEGEDPYTQFVEFSSRLNHGEIPATAGATGKVIFFDISAKDGTERDLLTINVTFE